MSEKELLAVLDMSEEEQVEFFYIKGYRQLVDTFPAGGLRIKYDKENNIISVKHSQSKLRFDRKALADLAFRLKDERKTNVQVSHFAASLREVHLYVRLNPDIHNTDFIPFWLYEAKPIHWIIAALLAKESNALKASVAPRTGKGVENCLVPAKVATAKACEACGPTGRTV